MPAAIQWTQELENAVIESIEAGDSLRQVAEKNSICPASIVIHFQSTDELNKRYARALHIRADADFEALTDAINAEPERTKFGIDSAWATWQRTRIDTMKWMVAKRNQAKYGDKLAHTGADGEGPLQVVVKHIGSDGESA
jgi:hypothetical protein